MFFELLLLRQVVLLAGCGAAAYTDSRTGLILDKITYPMIAAGIVLNIFEGQWLWLAAGAAVFALGYTVYYAGKLGGGDVKLFTGIAFLLPVLHNQIFLLNALFAACLLAITFYSAYYVAKYARKGIDWRESRQGIWKALFFALAICAWFLAMLFMQAVGWQTLLFLALPLLLAVLFLAFEKGIRRSFFLKQVSLGKLEEDEVIAVDFLDERVKQALGLRVKGVFGKKEKQTLREIAVKHVPVYRGMPPFAPFILLGCIAAMLEPDLIGMLFA